MVRPYLGWTLVLSGLGLIAIGYIEPTIIGGGARPYAYIAVIAVGAMFIIVGALMWRDR